MKSLPGVSTYTSTATQINPEDVYSRRSTLSQGENSPANPERFFIFSNFASAGEYSIPGGFFQSDGHILIKSHSTVNFLRFLYLFKGVFHD
jgi:hypothetical protein